MSREVLKIAVTLALVAGHMGAAFAQKYPVKPIRIITTASGGTAENILRAILPGLSRRLGQPIVLEARPGASHQIAAMAVKQSAPDGYTLLQGTYTIHVSNPVLLAGLDYDPDKDFKPITNLMRSSVLLTTAGSLPVQSVADLIALSKKKPGGLAYGGGIGTAQDLMMIAMLKGATGMTLLNVPYKSIAPIIPDILEGRVEISSLPPSLITQHIESGRIRAIALLDTQRIDMMPNLPTLAELGYPGVAYRYWFGLVAPAGTPDEIVRQLHQETTAVLGEPAMRDFARQRGLRVAASASPGEFAALMLSERAAEEKIAKEAGVYKSSKGD